MKRILFLVLIVMLTQSSCNPSAPTTNKEVKTSNPEKMDSTIALEPEPFIDSIAPDTTQVVKKAPEQKDTSTKNEKSKAEDNSINIEDALDVNKYKNVRDDPDYIGTPCEYIDGKCIRHDHKDVEKSPKNQEEEL